jgi:hypothetical protein
VHIADGGLDVLDRVRTAAREANWCSTRSGEHSSSTIVSSPVEKPWSNMRCSTRRAVVSVVVIASPQLDRLASD